MKIGLYFGSFNPIHVGHLIIANYMVDHALLDQVWFVISPHNPLKDKKTLLEDYHRLALVKEAIDDNPRLRASDIEFGMAQPNYTVKTLAVLKEKYPTYKFVLIMGEDNLNSLHKWYNYEYLLENYEIVVYPRITDANEEAKQVPFNHPSITYLKDVPIVSISSTFIRNLIKNGKDYRYLVTSPVYKYIDEMGFYKN
ncbi:MAG: nicotinate (nicotinamide) nucleotide adenylyltransferase [Crocinitomicaceae bacterium]|nr:nicotinate (nicotinamide) nucleotide adenylyltransferase [Crocinitomicaceae bacterium]